MSAQLEFVPKSLDQKEVSVIKRTAALVGVRGTVASGTDLARLAMKGLAADAVKRLASIGVAQKDLAFIIPPRTLTHRELRAERLTAEESDRALRLARVVAIGELVFGERDRALKWLTAGKRQFAGATPLAMLKTEIGARLVEELLWQIDEGYSA